MSDVNYNPDTNLQRVERNVKKMVEQDAPSKDILTYLNHEGFPSEEEYLKATEGFLDTATRKIGDAYDYAKEAVVGKQDPLYEGTPRFTGEGISDLKTRSGIEAGKVTAIEDEPYGDIVQRQLGDRLQETKRDENGNRIVTYQGDDGETYERYINTPGLDAGDVERGVASSLPYMAAGGAAGTGARALGLGVPGRMMAQGLSQAATSLATDKGATELGSKQGYDAARAGIAGGSGAVFEGLSGPIQRAWQAVFRKYGLAANGTLSAEAADQARRIGLDPDDMTERMKKQMMSSRQNAASEDELGVKMRTGEFDIRTTLGGRTKDPNQIGHEQDMRDSLLGDPARDIMEKFDKNQSEDIGRVVKETIPDRVAPGRSGVEPATVGNNIAVGARKGLSADRQKEKDLWTAVEPVFPKEEALKMIPEVLQNKFVKSSRRPDMSSDSLTPVSKKMVDLLDKYWKGEKMEEPAEVLGQIAVQSDIDSMRRRLLAIRKDAGPGTNDAKIAKDLYDGFNDWIGVMAEKLAEEGMVENAVRLRAARGFTKDLHDLYYPTARGKKTPGARILEKVMDNWDTPERVIQDLFGAAGAQTKPPQGTVQALKHLKRITKDDPDVWNDVRLAYWVKIAQDNKAGALSPQKLKNNIEQAVANQPSVLGVLYTPNEVKLLKRLGTALEDVIVPMRNTSGTARETERIRRKYGGGRTGVKLTKQALQTQATRELFSKKNVLMSRFYRAVAGMLPTPMGVQQSASRRVARDATSQEVQKRLPRSLGGPGTAAGVQAYED